MAARLSRRARRYPCCSLTLTVPVARAREHALGGGALHWCGTRVGESSRVCDCARGVWWGGLWLRYGDDGGRGRVVLEGRDRVVMSWRGWGRGCRWSVVGQV